MRVDLQLMLPSAASRKGSKLLPAASTDGSTSSGSSCYSSAGSSSLASQASDAEEAAGSSSAGAVVLQVRPEAAAPAAGGSQAAAAATLSPLAHSSSCPSSFLTAAAAAAAAAGSDDGDDDDEGLCTICYDQPATCVLMECGHGGYCWRCAHLLFARPPSECPVCRQPIMQVCGAGLWAGTVRRTYFLAKPTHRAAVHSAACVLLQPGFEHPKQMAPTVGHCHHQQALSHLHAGVDSCCAVLCRYWSSRIRAARSGVACG